MAIGKEKLISLVNVAFEEVETESSEEAIIGVAILVLEVREREAGTTAFYTFSTDKRTWVQRAALTEALEFVSMTGVDA